MQVYYNVCHCLVQLLLSSTVRVRTLYISVAADMDAKTASLVASILAPVLTISILLMICRIPLSWYPNLNVKKLPWVIAVAPTEPILGPTRKAIPPVGGVDIAPVSYLTASPRMLSPGFCCNPGIRQEACTLRPLHQVLLL